MGLRIQANDMVSRQCIAKLNFNSADPGAEQFLILMTVQKGVIRRKYAIHELRQARKNAVNVILEAEGRKVVKNFLTACIKSSETTGSATIDIWFE
jgi:hypothetical protein